MYQHSLSTAINSNSPDFGPTPGDMLAAAREHQRYLRTVPPRDYEMRIHEDGSVFFHNYENPNYDALLSFEEVRERLSEKVHLSPHRKFWQHIFWLWA